MATEAENYIYSFLRKQNSPEYNRVTGYYILIIYKNCISSTLKYTPKRHPDTTVEQVIKYTFIIYKKCISITCKCTQKSMTFRNI